MTLCRNAQKQGALFVHIDECCRVWVSWVYMVSDIVKNGSKRGQFDTFGRRWALIRLQGTTAFRGIFRALFTVVKNFHKIINLLLTKVEGCAIL